MDRTNPHKVIGNKKSQPSKTKVVRKLLYIGPTNFITAIPGPLNTFLFLYRYDEPLVMSKDKTIVKGKKGIYLAKYMIRPYINMADFLIDKLEYYDRRAFLDDLNNK